MTIDWSKPLQWNDGTPIEDVVVRAVTSFGQHATEYEVSGPTPSNWPEDCVTPPNWVTVSPEGAIEGWENVALKVQNVPEETGVRPIDWSQPIAWFDGTPAVINDDCDDDFWERGVSEEGCAVVLIPDHIGRLINESGHYDGGVVVEYDGSIVGETRIPMPCIKNSSGSILPPNRAKIKDRQIDREREAMEQNPLWGSF